MRAPEEIDAGSFAVVMATGIVGADARLEGIAPLANVLIGLACAAWVVLAVVVGDRVRRHPRNRPRLQSFAVVAGTAVIGADFAAAGRGTVALALWSLAALLWLALLSRGPQAGELSGSSLLVVVGTESLAVLGALVAARRGAPLVSVAVAAWALGLALYPFLHGAVLAAAGRDRRFNPDHWILMGALAITTLAGSELVAALRALHELSGFRDVLLDTDLATWAVAAAVIPPLVAVELRVRRWRYEAARWGFVFPLGMYGAASHVLGAVNGSALLRDIGTAFFAAGLAAWVLTAAGLGRRGAARARA